MKRILILAVVALSFVSCEKIIAEDISNELSVLILPSAGDTLANNPVHFKWEPIYGATRYHLMVVSPSFSNINSYVLDTLVTDTEFFFDLDSNVYELKLSATNGAYTTQVLGPVQFWVGVSSGSSGSNVVLNSPAADVFKNASFSGQFSWNALSGSGTYEFSLRSGTNFATGTILDNQNNLGTLSYTSSLTLAEGAYIWGVKQYFSTGFETPFSTRILYIDLSDPNVALLSTPVDFATQSPGDIVFTWSNGTDPGSIHAPVSSELEIASDAAFATVVNSLTVAGNTATINLPAGTYYWRVSNMDEAGNTAAPSDSHKLTVF